MLLLRKEHHLDVTVGSAVLGTFSNSGAREANDALTRLNLPRLLVRCWAPMAFWMREPLADDLCSY
jgi:hypothetical protein